MVVQACQMQDDEESMMAQMRGMELALAKDRAELARQRAEVQRLHNELKHEIEVASRDTGLRDRLISLQRRHSATAIAPPSPGPSAETPLPQPPPAGVTRSGLFRRIFGAGH